VDDRQVAGLLASARRHLSKSKELIETAAELVARAGPDGGRSPGEAVTIESLDKP
jgi:hypothetical protein